MDAVGKGIRAVKSSLEDFGPWMAGKAAELALVAGSEGLGGGGQDAPDPDALVGLEALKALEEDELGPPDVEAVLREQRWAQRGQRPKSS